MKDDSPLGLGGAMFPMILLLFATTSSAKPLDYEDVANLLPTEPQTTNDTLAAIVQDPVVQDAVQDTVGNGSLEGLVVKKKVLVMPATQPTKVVSEREQVLIVPMTHLEDVKKNITETVNAETDVDGLALADIQSFTEDDKDEYEDESNPIYASQRNDFYETLTGISKTTREPMFPVDNNTPQEVLHSPSDPSQEMKLPEQPSPTISVPIIAFLDPAKISDDKIDVTIAATLSKQDDSTLKSQLNLLENGREEIQRNVQNYVDENLWSVNLDNWRLASSPSEIQVSSSLYEPTTIEAQTDVHSVNDIHPENPLLIAMPRRNTVVTPLFWISDSDANYPKEPHDMDVAAHIIFRPLFRFRQEAQRKSWRRGADNYRRSAYRRYNSYDSYPRQNYRYRPRYSDDYYY